MSKWHFKRTVKQADGSITNEDLTAEQATKISKYETALKQGLASTASNPIFSGYHVRGGIGASHSAGYAALFSGNFEYGFCQALHNEETAIAVLRSVVGRGELSDVVLGLISGEEGNIATPCGNCRDLLLDDLGTDIEIVTGAPDGGLALVTNMEDYLFDDFTQITDVETLPSDFKKKVQIAVTEGNRIENNAYFSGKSNRRYRALLNGYGEDFVGALDLMCEFHPIYPVRDAIRVARRKHDPYVRYVVIVAEESEMEDPQKPPHVMYKDRQHLLEFNLQRELVEDEEFNPLVYLVTVNRQERSFGGDQINIANVWQTSVKEWLPLPFTPRNFGDAFVKDLTTYFDDKTRG